MKIGLRGVAKSFSRCEFFPYGVNKIWIFNLVFQGFCGIPAWRILTYMTSLAMANAYTMRLCLSTTLTEMVGRSGGKNNIGEEVCPSDDLGGSASDEKGPYHHWDEQYQGLILSSFYFGYVVTHIPGGILSEKYGGKWPLAIGLLISGKY
jgi:ACS family sodium-dependent inorganic phosphate cotransporter